MCADGWLVMLACAPLTCLICSLSLNTTHASGSLLLLQLVSDRLASRHVVYDNVPLLPRCVLMAGRLC
jgi:hypothetical protein